MVASRIPQITRLAGKVALCRQTADGATAKRTTMLTNVGSDGAVALSLALAGPAMAGGGHATHSVHRQVYGLTIYRMPAPGLWPFRPRHRPSDLSLRLGRPYGDGEYPGSINANIGPPYWAAR